MFTFSLYPSIGCGHHQMAILGIGCQHAMVTGEIRTRSGYERRQLGQKLHRLEDKVGGAIFEGVFQFVNHLTCLLGGQPVKGQRGPGHIAAQPFQTIPLVRLAGDSSIQREAVSIDRERFGLSVCADEGLRSQGQQTGVPDFLQTEKALRSAIVPFLIGSLLVIFAIFFWSRRRV